MGTRPAGGTRRSGQDLPAQARVGNSLERSFRAFLAPDLLILDDLGLHRFTSPQSADLYELILNRHRVSSFVITSNRAVDEWLSLFDDPVLGNSAPDRPANAREPGMSKNTVGKYLKAESPPTKLLSAKERAKASALAEVQIAAD